MRAVLGPMFRSGLDCGSLVWRMGDQHQESILDLRGVGASTSFPFAWDLWSLVRRRWEMGVFKSSESDICVAWKAALERVSRGLGRTWDSLCAGRGSAEAVLSPMLGSTLLVTSWVAESDEPPAGRFSPSIGSVRSSSMGFVCSKGSVSSSKMGSVCSPSLWGFSSDEELVELEGEIGWMWGKVVSKFVSQFRSGTSLVEVGWGCEVGTDEGLDFLWEGEAVYGDRFRLFDLSKGICGGQFTAVLSAGKGRSTSIGFSAPPGRTEIYEIGGVYHSSERVQRRWWRAICRVRRGLFRRRKWFCRRPNRRCWLRSFDTWWALSRDVRGSHCSEKKTEKEGEDGRWEEW